MTETMSTPRSRRAIPTQLSSSHHARARCQVIPTRLETDTCPVPGADGADALWVTDEEMPRADASIDDGLVGVPNQGGQFVAAQESPDVFHRIEFGAVGG